MKSSLLVSSVILAVCTTASGQQRDQSVEKRLSDLEKRVTALEKGFAAANRCPFWSVR
jgi:hypothetical protein